MILKSDLFIYLLFITNFMTTYIHTQIKKHHVIISIDINRYTYTWVKGLDVG